jgi:hypothetical protein
LLLLDLGFIRNLLGKPTNGWKTLIDINRFCGAFKKACSTKILDFFEILEFPFENSEVLDFLRNFKTHTYIYTHTTHTTHIYTNKP